MFHLVNVARKTFNPKPKTIYSMLFNFGIPGQWTAVEQRELELIQRVCLTQWFLVANTLLVWGLGFRSE